LLAAHLALGALAAAGAASEALFPSWGAKAAFSASLGALVLGAPFALLYALENTPAARNGRSSARRVLEVLALGGAFAALAAFAYLEPPERFKVEERPDLLFLGPGAYLGAIYLLGVSVATLALLERIVRGADERVRWEVKFLVIGLGAFAAGIVYLSSGTLLYPAGYGLVASGTLRALPAVFLLSSALVAVSWARTSERGAFALSQTAAFSSVTLLAVGAYLVAASLTATWASELFRPDVATGFAIFALFGVAAASFLLSTTWRNRLRNWFRLHVYRGRYDYRQSWLEASRRIRSVDPPEEAAAAYAELVSQGLGAVEVLVWRGDSEASALRLLHARGAGKKEIEEAPAVPGSALTGLEGALSARDFAARAFGPRAEEWLARTGASVVLPLRSGEHTIGLVAVGSDRSGGAYSGEALEFLRVLTEHAAGELLQADLIRERVEAREAEAFRTFSTFLLHDLKNLASTLSLVAKNAERHAGNPQFLKDAFQAIFEAAEKMRRLCGSLKAFSGGLSAERASEDLAAIARKTVESLGGAIPVRLELEEPAPFRANAEEVASVIRNLLLNAAEASPPGSEVTLRVRRDGVWLELEVVDRGRGIPKEFLERDLFQPFRTTKPSGLGIGLYQAKRVIEAHGGRIEVASEEGRGTRVRVRVLAGGGEETPGGGE
ncbi:MAG: XrtA/PEP-CTERM system histidine kinase PrsK, partial [Planctomycetota bacterium]